MPSSATARLLDVTRLLSSVGRGPITGVDRVEFAYLRAVLAETEPVFFLARTAFGFLLLDRKAAPVLQRALAESSLRPSKGVFRYLRDPKWKVTNALRRHAVARSLPSGLGGMLRKHLPSGTCYVNVGHSNLETASLAAIRSVPGLRITVMVHDTIPLDFPQYSRAGVQETFEAKLRATQKYADLVLYNSRQTQLDAERWFGKWGAVPAGMAAHLGIEVMTPKSSLIPPDLPLDRPYFVALGTIEPRKNHAFLLEIWRRFSTTMDPGEIPYLFVIGNRGWHNLDVFTQLDTAPFMRRTVFEVANLPDEGVAAVLEGAAGLLFPSIAEGFGLPPIEAAALGVNVVCNDLPIYKEILGNIPVYGSVNDRYLWETIIVDLARKARRGKQREGLAITGPCLPTWENHFNLVLKVT